MTARTNYFFRYYNPSGQYGFDISSYHSARIWVDEGQIGAFYIDIPYTQADHIIDKLELDGMFEIYKTFDTDRSLLFNKRWFLRLWRDKIEENGVKYLRLRTLDCNNLMDRRIVAYEQNTAYTKKIDMPADDMIKAIARENFGSLCVDPTRDISDYLDIAPDRGDAPVISYEGFHWLKVLPLFENIANMAYSEDETYLTYNVSWQPDQKKFLFDTFVGQLGVDRGANSSAPLYLTAIDNVNYPAWGGLNQASIALDGIDTRSRVYCGLRAENKDSVVATATDEEELARSPFGLWEGWDFSQAEIDEDDYATEGEAKAALLAALQVQADARLQDWKPFIVLNGHMSDTFARYVGKGFGWGDIIVFKFKNKTEDVHLNKVTIDLNDTGAENIKVFTRNMEESYY